MKITKENLSGNELIILLDFAENYSFVVQDAAQGFRWENSQATLHPFVEYFRSSNGDLKHTSMCCVISDSSKYDQTPIHCFLTKVITLMKQKVNNIKITHYYSDGTPSQYKSYKGLVNLCHHKLDRGINSRSNMAATARDKMVDKYEILSKLHINYYSTTTLQVQIKIIQPDVINKISTVQSLISLPRKFEQTYG